VRYSRSWEKGQGQEAGKGSSRTKEPAGRIEVAAPIPPRRLLDEQYSTDPTYGSGAMRVVSALTRSGIYLAHHPPLSLSPKAKARLNCFAYYESHGRNASLACRHFGISRTTFYRWRRRYYPARDPRSLEDRPSTPKKRRERTWTLDQIEAVRRLRRQYPRWGKDKLAVMLAREGLKMNVSRVGRIIAYLKGRGVLPEPKRRSKRTRRGCRRVYATRFDRSYEVRAPGDLVQLDCLDVRPLPGVVLKQFTARDVVSRYDVLDIASCASSVTATAALEGMLERLPFAVRAIQVDGGSEFMGRFEQACQRRGIRLFELPPRSPKLNGYVERANRTHAEEFHDCTDVPASVVQARRLLRDWEHTYNHVRPHQSLGYLTPHEFLEQWQQQHPSTSPDCN
jgi:putative transposase